MSKKTETALVQVVEESGLQATQADRIIKSFVGFAEQVKQWETAAKKIVVKDENDTEAMNKARQARLELKAIRVEAEKTRKKLKERSLREGKAIDGIANVLKHLIVPIEEHLDEQEKFAERAEAARKHDLWRKRHKLLAPLVPDTTAYNLEDMEDDAFEILLKDSKVANEARLKAEKEAEAKRIEEEKAEAVRRKEAEAQAKKAEAARKKEEAKRLAEQKKREAAEAKLAKQRELERKRKEEERKKKAAEAKAKRDAELAPDKEKLRLYGHYLLGVAVPTDSLKDKKAKIIADEARARVEQVIDFIEAESESL